MTRRVFVGSKHTSEEKPSGPAVTDQLPAVNRQPLVHQAAFIRGDLQRGGSGWVGLQPDGWLEGSGPPPSSYKCVQW